MKNAIRILHVEDTPIGSGAAWATRAAASVARAEVTANARHFLLFLSENTKQFTMIQPRFISLAGDDDAPRCLLA